ncbi:hypothetical protein [Pseudogemmobacter bohemicus]|uniref:hypothetical protein n=1 Tax=Pseudogemmobacter bohemicus TaxID=2250708 RepID=UPI000DD42F04|nr:hypothetical protein [Pseudogemmobacter bohemicus]
MTVGENQGFAGLSLRDARLTPGRNGEPLPEAGAAVTEGYSRGEEMKMGYGLDIHMASETGNVAVTLK